MTRFEGIVLPNGLRVIVHEDHSTPMAVLNMLYDVGARDEEPNHTGFAHLFEHLMFGGSVHIPDFDQFLQMAGGEDNAYTTNDLTNYYIQLPAENIETACWLESDRMLSLAFSEKNLEVQRRVVIEEFREHYLNKPYGDAWKLVRELVYQEHPYRWMTIGREPGHIEKASLDEVKQFFFRHYTPSNAILVLAGNIGVQTAFGLAEKWFGPIPAGEKYQRNIPQEPPQLEARHQEVRRPVPLDALYMAYPICARKDPAYYATDLITDLLSGGGSSRLFQALVKEKKLFSQIECFHFGSLDRGLLTIEGKLVKGVPMEVARQAVEEELRRLQQEALPDRELEKVKNRMESLIAFEDLKVLNRAINLAFYELLGDAALMDREMDHYRSVTGSQIRELAASLFRPEHANTLYYVSEP